jgi:two-component system LytT family response regulator
MTLRCIIADDEPLARELTRAMLGAHDDVIVVGEFENGREVIEAAHTLRPDVVFLDIRMPELSGLEAVAALEGDSLPAIVFVTAYDEYAMRAFDMAAVDYLLKPFDGERLGRALDRVRRLVARPDRSEETRRMLALLETLGARAQAPLRRLPVRTGVRTILQPVDQILWVEADGKFVRIHLAEGHLTMRESLQNVEARPDPQQFMRVSRSAIVNLDFVREVQPWFKGDFVLILKNGTEIISTRGFRHAVARLLGQR